jgi:hypothetical protein
VNKGATWGAIGIVALATLTFSFRPSGHGGERGSGGKGSGTPLAQSTGASKKIPAKSKLPANKTPRTRACDDLADDLAEFLKLGDVNRPPSCFDDTADPADNPYYAQTPLQQSHIELRYVMATLPDPIHTHLALMFDRLTEVIQEAAQDETYAYEVSWLPWDDKAETYQKLKDDDEESDRKDFKEKQPGILIFRRTHPPKADDHKVRQQGPLSDYHHGLIVFVVGEDPTRGIHSEQFNNALAWVAELQNQFSGNEPPHLTVFGPTFSGSLPSLAKLLYLNDSDGHLKIRDATKCMPVYTGSANSAAAITNFESMIDLCPSSGANVPAPLQVDFRSFLERDEDVLERFCEYVRDDGFLEPKDIAVVSEDETPFGAREQIEPEEPQTAGNPPVQKAEGAPGHREKNCPCMQDAHWFSYPRDISALRTAYQTNSLFDTPGTPQTAPETVRDRLPTDLADPAGDEHDTIRSYASNQEPLSEEAYLLGISNAMRVYRTQYVILHSTNVFDQLFLAHYFRQAYPDARIITVSVDQLFERERGSIGMGGTMAISTFPLIERERDWVNGKETSSVTHRLFQSDQAEGSYIAFRELLNSSALNESNTAQCLGTQNAEHDPGRIDGADAVPGILRNAGPDCSPPDYGVPSWLDNPHVPRRPAVWLAALGRDGYWPIAVLSNATTAKCSPYNKSSTLPIAVPVSLIIFLLATLAVCVFHLWCCRDASFTGKPSFRAYFALANDSRRSSKWDEWRHPTLVFLGSMSLGLIPLFTAWACGMFRFSRSISPLICLLLVVEFWIVAAATRSNLLRVHELNRGGHRNTQTEKAMLAAAWKAPLFVLLAFVVGFVLPMNRFLLPANEIFTQYRALHLTSGVSQLVPVFALSVGFYIWFWNSLHGLALFGPDRNKLPDVKNLVIKFEKVSLNVLRMFSNETAQTTEGQAKPLRKHFLELTIVIFFILLAVVFALNELHWPLRSLGPRYASQFFLCWLLLCASLMLTDAYQLLKVWTRLSELLVFLDRLTLRRTLSALRGFSWGSVWAMSGNVLDVRYKLLSRQLECLGHLVESLKDFVENRERDRVRCGAAAQSIATVLGQLRNSKINTSQRKTLTKECLKLLKQLRSSASPDLQSKIDLAHEGLLAALLSRNIAANGIRALEECIDGVDELIRQEYPAPADAERTLISALDETRLHGLKFAQWYNCRFDKADASNLEVLTNFQDSVAKVSGQLLTELLIPEWMEEQDSLILDDEALEEASEGKQKAAPLSEKPHIRNAEEFVCLPYLGFVQNILGRIRTIIMGMLSLFVATAVALSSYPFDPRQGLSAAMIALFIVLGAAMLYVYAQMHRDTTLSHVTNTTPGELGLDFWLKSASFGIAPVLGLLATVFPQVSDFIFSWLEPGIQSMK